MKENAYIASMADQNGTTTYEGRTYVLLEPARMEGQQNPDRVSYSDEDGNPVEACSRRDFYVDPHYEAVAVCLEDTPDDLNTVPAYLIRWEILPETWEYWDDGGEDEGDACDWSRPESVRECGGWDLDNNRSC